MTDLTHFGSDEDDEDPFAWHPNPGSCPVPDGTTIEVELVTPALDSVPITLPYLAGDVTYVMPTAGPHAYAIEVPFSGLDEDWSLDPAVVSRITRWRYPPPPTVLQVCRSRWREAVVERFHRLREAW